MSDNDVLNEEEIKQVEELLGKSRKERLKNKPKAEKPKNENPKGQEGKKFDIVGIICIVLAACAAVGILVYFVVPLFATKTLNLTIDEFEANFSSSSYYTNILQSSGDITFGDVSYTSEEDATTESIALNAGDSGSSTTEKKNVTYFTSTVISEGEIFDSYLQGSISNNSNQLVALRVVARMYKPSNLTGDERTTYLSNRINMVLYYYKACLQAVMPDLTDEEAETLFAQARQNYVNGDTETYTSNGDISFKFSLTDNDLDTYFYLDIINTGNVDS